MGTECADSGEFTTLLLLHSAFNVGVVDEHDYKSFVYMHCPCGCNQEVTSVFVCVCWAMVFRGVIETLQMMSALHVSCGSVGMGLKVRWMA